MRSEAQRAGDRSRDGPAAARARRARARGRRARRTATPSPRCAGSSATRPRWYRPAARREHAGALADAREETDRLTHRVAELRERQAEMHAGRPSADGRGSNDCNRECARSDGSADERRAAAHAGGRRRALPDQHPKTVLRAIRAGRLRASQLGEHAAYRIGRGLEAWIAAIGRRSRRVPRAGRADAAASGRAADRRPADAHARDGSLDALTTGGANFRGLAL